jgi:hypothetical protein
MARHKPSRWPEHWLQFFCGKWSMSLYSFTRYGWFEVACFWASWNPWVCWIYPRPDTGDKSGFVLFAGPFRIHWLRFIGVQ